MREIHAYFDNYLQTNGINERLTLFLNDSEFIDSGVTYVEPLRLRQALSNLIDNAIKFTKTGYVRFGYRKLAPDQLEFFVEDTGIGFAPDFQKVIFESFRQAELTNSRPYGGNGLGLTIARGLVQMMGGDIRIESAEGEGSTFYFTVSYLPVVAEDRSFFDNPRYTSQDEKPFADKRILVVEPVVMKYMYYENLLSAAGFTVHHAGNVHQWLDFIRQTNHIDAVMVNAAVFDHAYEVEISQIKSIRAGLPMFMYGVKGNMKHGNGHKYTELEEPMDYGKIVEAMRGVGR
jgi:anti-sigma regulatory factor (Ser/Thr protein kinase)